MGTVYFCNREAIDLSAIAVMGVSVKVADNPIGYFGTGLKFSIATLLRTGHKIALIRDGQRIVFSSDAETIRGEKFQRVKMGDERLGFTTQLGRNWEPWQAYREMHCNCTDEGGVISADSVPDGEWGTVFEIEGDAITLAHRNKRKIFLDSSPLFATDECEIHAGETHDAFYRGVKAHKHQQHAMFTYNIVDALELTEDRTVKYGYYIAHYVVQAITQCQDEDVIETALMAPRGTFEQGIDYSAASKPTLAFMDVAFRLRQNHHCNRSAIKLWEKHSDVRLTFTEATLDSYEESQIDKAIALVARLGVDIDRRDFTVVEGLGASIFGCVRASRILIAKATLDMGVRFTASTLYEEWLHKNQSMEDESRALQNLLFEKLFSMVERICGMEAAAKDKVAA